MANVVIKKLSKRFGKTQVLRDLDLSIRDGEFVVIVGPSGCGKSTLLRCIAGLESISSGDLFIDETRVNDFSPKQRDIAMVFQSYALYPHMTVKENMSFGLSIRRVDQQEIERRVSEAAQFLELTDLLHRFPKQLSGGQRQRVAMGRAIVRNPKVFLFDEPLSNLDASLRVQMRTELSRLHKRLGSTMIYVTHDQVEAMTLADRIVVLKNGELQQVGSPLDLYYRPANQFVGGFIGSPAMNFLRGRIINGSPTRPNFQIEGITMPIPITPSNSAIGRSLMIGIRPEHLNLADAQEGKLLGKIELIEPMGFEANLYLRLPQEDSERQTFEQPNERELIVARVKGQKASELKLGSQVWLNILPERIYLFDAETGHALNATDPSVNGEYLVVH